MQTLISVFKDSRDARKAVEGLVGAGFRAEDIHVKERPAGAKRDDADDIGERTEHTTEREVAVDADTLDALIGMFRPAIDRGQSVVLVDARSDEEAETAATVLHMHGAIDVDDRESSGGTPAKPGVRAYTRESRVNLRDLAYQRQAREDSLLADRAGQVSKEMKEDVEERAYAKAMPVTTRDRPK
jgi:hypothetical protein